MSEDRRNTLKSPVIIVGGGGHGVVVAEAARLSNLEVVGFIDDNLDAPLSHPPEPVLWLSNTLNLHTIADRPWIMGFGNLAFRESLIAKLEQQELGRSAHSVIHPTAFVSPTARIGRGVFVGPRAVIHSRAAVYDHAIVNSGAIVEHDAIVGTNAHLAPGSIIAGGCRVGSSALVGIGARLLPMLSVGDNCVVGAGAVVVKSVVDKTTVIGVPARPRH